MGKLYHVTLTFDPLKKTSIANLEPGEHLFYDTISGMIIAVILLLCLIFLVGSVVYVLATFVRRTRKSIAMSTGSYTRFLSPDVVDEETRSSVAC